MVFDGYPKLERMNTILEKPLLEEGIPSSEASDDFEYEPRPILRTRYERERRKSCCVGSAIFLGVGIFTFILVAQSVLLWQLWDQNSRLEVLGEINGLIPSVATKPKLFTPDPTFDPLNATDPGWENVMPMGGGFVPIPSWRGKVVPPPIHTHGKDIYNVAVFHQLHCLHMLAEEFGNLLEGRQMGDTSRTGGHKSHGGAEATDDGLMMWHIRHCFEYIRNSLTCCADTTLEGQKSDTNLPATDGFGAQHVCRDFDAVFDWAEANRASDQVGYPHGTA